jgi:hypothetical protein
MRDPVAFDAFDSGSVQHPTGQLTTGLSAAAWS